MTQAVGRRSRAPKAATSRKISKQSFDASRFEQRLFALEVGLKRARGELAGLAGSLAQVAIDLNPHQVRAAVFALAALESGGCILADEVGLGKTIEAGLVIRQLASEGRNKVLILAPAPLRRQWQHELATKFKVGARILDSRTLNQAARASGGDTSGWHAPMISIASIPFAYNRRDEIAEVDWDLVVIDEAHRLRGIVRNSSRQARGLRDALAGRPKLLLTATPFQNDLLELYGLVSFVDPKLLGTDYSFTVRYGGDSQGDGEEPAGLLGELRERLDGVIQRTLRRQVTSYLPFTERHGVLTRFCACDAEDELRQDMAAYIASDESVIFQGPRRSLLSLVYHKLLASSPQALASGLQNLIGVLHKAKVNAKLLAEYQPILAQFDGAYDESEEEGEDATLPRHLDERAIEREIVTVKRLAARAESIKKSTKAAALTSSLLQCFAEAAARRQPRKAVVFTESKITQAHLRDLLSANPGIGKVVTFNGSNDDPESKETYERWLAADETRHELPRAIGTREAIVQRFRDDAEVLVATEAAAEGLNLQFCNIVVNYDMPWNPQRVEQRIGRCHRYGQVHDVVALNFIDERNPVDVRVHELLEKKFSLFDGVFGASDTPLGEVTTGVELERAIVDILRRCRTSIEIKGAFDRLGQKLDDAVSRHRALARKELLDNFHPDVVDDLLGLDVAARGEVAEFERRLARAVISEFAPPRSDRIDEGIFRVERVPADIAARAPAIAPGLFAVGGRRRDPSVKCQLLTIDHPLVRSLVEHWSAIAPDEIEDLILARPSTRAARLLGIAAGARGFWEVTRLTTPGGAERLVHQVALLEDGCLRFLEPESANELCSWETGGATANHVNELSPFPSDEFAAPRAAILQSHLQAWRRQSAESFQKHRRRDQRYASESRLETEHKIAEIERELPGLREQRMTALAVGDMATVDALAKVIDKLEERRLDQHRRRLQAEEQELACLQELVKREREEMQALPRCERVLAARFIVAR